MSTEAAKYMNSDDFFNHKSKPRKIEKRGTGSNEYCHGIGFPGAAHKISNDAHTEYGSLGYYMEYRNESENSAGRNSQTEEAASNSDPKRKMELEGEVIVGKNEIRLFHQTSRAVALQKNPSSK
nr:unnamed protein product [Callosobruchus analis]